MCAVNESGRERQTERERERERARARESDEPSDVNTQSLPTLDSRKGGVAPSAKVGSNLIHV